MKRHHFNRSFPIYCWFNAKVDCTYQSIVFNVILIDYALIRYSTPAWEKAKKEFWSLSHNCFYLPRACLIKIESEALVSTSDFPAVYLPNQPYLGKGLILGKIEGQSSLVQAFFCNSRTRGPKTRNGKFVISYNFCVSF